MKIMANSYTMYQTTNVSKKETNNEIKKVDDKKVGEVLGYGVDKDGFFTSDFNKAAGIPENFKIHSDSLKSLVEQNNKAHIIGKRFMNIDIAKSVGNAYKVLSQVVSEEFLNSKEFFSKEDIKNMPCGFEIDNSTFSVGKILQSRYDFEDYNDKDIHARDFQRIKGADTLFHYDGDGKMDMFPVHNDNFSQGYSILWDAKGDNYKNNQGDVSRGGILIAVLRNNHFLVEGERTYWGKMSGGDRFVDYKEFAQNVAKPLNSMVAKGLITQSDISKMPKWLADEANRLSQDFKRARSKELAKEFENIMKWYEKLLYEMLNANKLKAPKKLDDYETFEEFLKAALQYSQKNISLFDMKV
ncbi:hypothetical protein AVCANL279_08925 [Campylobacter canadensis]|nr:hypothetical protein [Campylobacter canadensis]MBZ7997429.1 hypothetical protein [Campylobacter canadensis]MBZ8004606.1 hypothetical protein [Campylobacter canadensis]